MGYCGGGSHNNHGMKSDKKKYENDGFSRLKLIWILTIIGVAAFYFLE